MTPFEALYEWQYRSLNGWFKIEEAKLLGPDLKQDSIRKLQLIKE